MSDQNDTPKPALFVNPANPQDTIDPSTLDGQAVIRAAMDRGEDEWVEREVERRFNAGLNVDGTPCKEAITPPPSGAFVNPRCPTMWISWDYWWTLPKWAREIKDARLAALSQNFR